jgi:subtilisin family serine protease
MASPHVAGVAALTRQAHPTWGVRDLRAAIVNTGSPSAVAAYRTARGGTGLVQPAAAAATAVVAHGDGGRFPLALNFGFEEFDRDLLVQKKIRLDNNGVTDHTFHVSQ